MVTLPASAAWKRAALIRLHEHFRREAAAAELSTAIFGAEAAKGLDLIELLSRRYDVVETNQPFMGSKSMGPALKSYVQRHCVVGKRDLHASFIERCLELVSHDGTVAMVAQQSWQFLGSYADLRKHILERQRVERRAHLGPRAFAEMSGDVVNVALFVLGRVEPIPSHRLWAGRLVGAKSPAETDALLREAIRATRATEESHMRVGAAP